MFSSAEKTTNVNVQRQQQPPQQTFFRKAGEESFFGAKESPSFFSPPIQAKLSVSSPDDPQEKEADAVADQVMRMPEPAAMPEKKEEEKVQKKEDSSSVALAKEEEKREEQVQAKLQAPVISIQRKCDACEKENHAQAKLFRMIQRSEDASSSPVPFGNTDASSDYNIDRKELSLYHSDVIQRSGRGPPTGSPHAVFEQNLSSSKGGGSPLPNDTKQFMETRFNADFSGVRIHTGSYAENLSSNIHAQAFTHGNDIYFNSGKYNPHTAGGSTLLAHELTHTIQQGASHARENTSASEDRKAEQSLHEEGDRQAMKSLAGPHEQDTATPPNTHSKENLQHEQNANEKSEKEVGTEEESTAGTKEKQADNDTAGREMQQTDGGEGHASTGSAKQGTGVQEATAGNDEPRQEASSSAMAGVIQLNQARPPPADEEAEKNNHTENILNAEESELKPHAVREALQINADYDNTRQQINLLANMRKQGIRNHFRSVYTNINTFFAGVQMGFFTSAILVQNLVAQNVNALAAGLNGFITAVSAGAIGFVNTIFAGVSGVIGTVMRLLGTGVSTVTSGIINLINRIPLPDLPGVTAVRNTVNRAITLVTGFISGLLARVQGFIMQVFAAVSSAIIRLIQRITTIITRILAVIQRAINRIIALVFRTIMNIVIRVIGMIQRIITGTIRPALTAMERILTGMVDMLRSGALEKARKKRDEALKAIAAMVTKDEGEESEEMSTQDEGVTTEMVVAQMAAIRQNLLLFNRRLVVSFMRETSSIFNMIVALIANAVVRIWLAVTNIIRQIMSVLQVIISAVIAAITGLISHVMNQVSQFIARIITTLTGWVQSVRTFIQHPVDSMLSFISSLASRVWSFLSGLARNLVTRIITADFSAPSTSQLQNQLGLVAPAYLAPAPVIIEVIVIVVEAIIIIGGVIIVIVEGGVIIIVGGVAIVLTTAEAIILIIIIVVLVIIALIILAIILYLLYQLIKLIVKKIIEEIVKRRRRRKKRKCKPGEIYDPSAPSGTSKKDPIDIIWYKPLSAYPDPIVIRGRDYYMTSPDTLPPPLDFITIGVDSLYLPYIGKIMMIFHQRNRNQEAKFKRRLRAAGYSWKTTRTSPDHVQDLMWNGPDEFENLWPLDSGINSRAGSKQNMEQLIYFRPDPKKPCAVRLRIDVARATYSMSSRFFRIASFALP